MKQFELVVDAYKAGQEMDLSELPTPEAIAAAFKSQQKGEDSVQNSTGMYKIKTNEFKLKKKENWTFSSNTFKLTEASPPEPTPEPAGLITASTLAEALKQRLAAFQVMFN